jgi:hypothetical protein
VHRILNRVEPVSLSGSSVKVCLAAVKIVAKATLRPTFDRERTRSETLDRCDDLQAGQTHEHTLDDRYSQIALGRCLQDCLSLILWSVASPRPASVPRVALSSRLWCAGTLPVAIHGQIQPQTRCAGTLVGGYFTGNFSTEGGVVSKTACIVERVYAYEMTETCGDGICCQYGAGESKITVSDSLIVFIRRKSLSLLHCVSGPYRTSFQI